MGVLVVVVVVEVRNLGKSEMTELLRKQYFFSKITRKGYRC